MCGAYADFCATEIRGVSHSLRFPILNNRPLVSILLPCFNEVENVNTFLTAFWEAVGETQCRFEFVFIDDGSTDDTLYLVKSLSAKDKRIRYVALSRNFGKEIALSAGLDFAKGDAVIPMDIDLQDPPSVVPLLIKQWQSGYDVVNAVRTDRSSDSFLKRTTAMLFYKLINLISDQPVPNNVGDFRLISSEPLKAIKAFKERRRFMKGLVSWVGFTVTSVEYKRSERSGGKTKFNFVKLMGLAIEGIVSFSSFPLKISMYLGFLTSMSAIVYMVFVVVRTWVYGNSVSGYPSLLAFMLFLGGCQLISLGILGAYVGRIFDEVKSRPLYFVKETEKTE